MTISAHKILPMMPPINAQSVSLSDEFVDTDLLLSTIAAVVVFEDSGNVMVELSVEFGVIAGGNVSGGMVLDVDKVFVVDSMVDVVVIVGVGVGVGVVFNVVVVVDVDVDDVVGKHSARSLHVQLAGAVRQSCASLDETLQSNSRSPLPFPLTKQFFSFAVAMVWFCIVQSMSRDNASNGKAPSNALRWSALSGDSQSRFLCDA